MTRHDSHPLPPQSPESATPPAEENSIPTGTGNIGPAAKLRLRQPHPLVERLLNRTPPEKDRFGFPLRPEPRQIDVHVSKTQQRTALIVMDRFFKRLEAEGLEIALLEGQESGTYAVRGRDKTRISLGERYRDVEHIPTAKELKEKEQRPYTRIPKWDSVATGTIALSPGGVVDASSEEAITQLVTKAVTDVVACLDKARLERERQEERQHQEWARQREVDAEKSRVTALHKATESLHRYRLMMDYIEEVRRFGEVPPDQRKEGQSLDDWLHWAEWQARIIHPLG